MGSVGSPYLAVVAVSSSRERTESRELVAMRAPRARAHPDSLTRRGKRNDDTLCSPQHRIEIAVVKSRTTACKEEARRRRLELPVSPPQMVPASAPT
jgi:hypothetical protein